jgi:signal peptidase I
VQLDEPERGDVVVFRLPSDPSVNYIKRVVGLPGDIVDYDAKRKRITINGEPVEIAAIGAYEDDIGIVLAHETLGSKEHEVLLTRNAESRGGQFRVPEGHYFMMGDNRDNSKDSRYEGVEYIPEGNLVGRAVRIWMSWRPPSAGGPRWSRIGQSIN